MPNTLTGVPTTSALVKVARPLAVVMSTGLTVTILPLRSTWYTSAADPLVSLKFTVTG